MVLRLISKKTYQTKQSESESESESESKSESKSKSKSKYVQWALVWIVVLCVAKQYSNFIALPHTPNTTTTKNKTTTTTNPSKPIELEASKNFIALPQTPNKTTKNKTTTTATTNPSKPIELQASKVIEVKVYNPWDRIRYVCGQLIRARQRIVLNVTVVPITLNGAADTVVDHDLQLRRTNDENKTKISNNNNCEATVDADGTIRLFSSSRTFFYDPGLPIPGITGLGDNTNISNKTSMQEQQTQQQQITTWIPKMTMRFDKDVETPLLQKNFHTHTGGGGVGGENFCDVPCEYYGKFLATKQFLTYEGTPFRMVQISKEGSGYHPELEVDQRAHLKQAFYATTSFQSSIPITYYTLKRQKKKFLYSDLRWRSPVDFDTGIKGASFVAKNCQSKNNREDLVKHLILVTTNTSTTTTTSKDPNTNINHNHTPFRIDSLGRCIPHNLHLLPNNITGKSNKEKIMKQYLFHLAFENHNLDDYVTEKLWGSLQAGTIPVYFGASNIRDILPCVDCVVVVSDFAYDQNEPNTPLEKYKYGTTHDGGGGGGGGPRSGSGYNIDVQALANHLYDIANNQTLYDSYHAWRLHKHDKPKHAQPGVSAIAENAMVPHAPIATSSHTSISALSGDVVNHDERYLKFLDKFYFTRTDLICRMCRFGYAMQYGWGWNHHRQEVQGLQLPSYEHWYSTVAQGLQLPSYDSNYIRHNPDHFFNRSTCFETATRRMVYPLAEWWGNDDHEEFADKELVRCENSVSEEHSRRQHSHRRVVHSTFTAADNESNTNTNTIAIANRADFVRTVWDHDGVTDMVISRLLLPTTGTAATTATTEHNSTFRFDTPFRIHANGSTEFIKVQRHVGYGPHFRKDIPMKPDQRAVPRIFLYENKKRFWEERGTLVWVQDATTRIVVMTDAPDTIRTVNPDPTNGPYDQIEIVLPIAVQTLRLRWIVEDIDNFHSDDTDEGFPDGKESYFSSYMVDDFFRPLRVKQL